MLNKKLIVSAFLAVSTAALITACDDDKNKSVNVEDVKSNYVEMAYGVYSDSLTTAKELEVAVDALLEKPSEKTLEEARNAYKATRKPYQQSEIMRWDTIITMGNKLDEDGGLSSVDDWEGQVNAWPLDEVQIEAIIAGSDTITKQLLIDRNGQLPDGSEDEANVTTGVHAIEFLLWDQDVSARGPGSRAFNEFGKDADCKNVESIACRTSKYLKVAIELLVDDLTTMKAEWSPSASTAEGTLAYNYLNSDEALDYMVQAIGSMAVGELGGARLSAGLWRLDVPFKGDVKDGDYEEEHDCFSDLSHVAVYYNFQGIMNAWNGTYTKLDGAVIKGASLADYAKAIDKATYGKLNNVFAAAKTEMQVIYEAGEKEGEDRKSFDQIIEDSRKAYVQGDKKSAELEAIESALVELAKVEELIVDLAKAMSLDAVDGDEIGETD